MNEPDRAPEEVPGFFERPKNVDRIYFGLLVVCAGLVLADLAYDKHGHFAFEALPAFHAVFGFLAYVGLVLAATQLRRLIKRREDYYD